MSENKINFSNYRLFSTNTHTGNPSEEVSLELYFYEYYRLNKHRFPEDYEYIPVFWRAYDYAKRAFFAPEGLQEKLDSLDSTKKYFTVSSCFSDMPAKLPKRTKVFSAANNFEGYDVVPIPLATYQHDKPTGQLKKVRCSFIGLNHTHPCREMMFKKLRENSDFVFFIRNRKKLFDIASHKMKYSPEEYKEYIVSICQSEFVLCPRGIGPTSQRLYEVMEIGAVPIYIYDEPFLPYQNSVDWDKLAIMIHESEIGSLSSIVERKSREEIIQYRKEYERLRDSHFTRNAVCDYILKQLHSVEPE
jgi:hypothetical protein